MGRAQQLQTNRTVTAHNRPVSLAVATSGSSTGPITVSLRGPENRALGRLSLLVGNVVSSLEGRAGGEPLSKAVAECNTALEAALEANRESSQHEGSVSAASDELKRLAKLLMTVDRAEAAIIMRQIRRVLGRFDGVERSA